MTWLGGAETWLGGAVTWLGGAGRQAMSGVEVDAPSLAGCMFERSHLALRSTVTVESKCRANSGLISSIVLAHGIGF